MYAQITTNMKILHGKSSHKVYLCLIIGLIISSCGKYVLKTLLLNLEEFKAKKLIEYVKLYVDSKAELESRTKNYWNSVYNMLKKKFSHQPKKTAMKKNLKNDDYIAKDGDDKKLFSQSFPKTEEMVGLSRPYMTNNVCFGYYNENSTSPKLTSINNVVTSSVYNPYKGSSNEYRGSNPGNFKLSTIRNVELGDAMKKATLSKTSMNIQVQQYMINPQISYSRYDLENYTNFKK